MFNTTNYVLCLYDQSAGVPNLTMAADIPAGGTCDGRPCWMETTRGFKYKNKAGTPGGVVTFSAKEGLAGKPVLLVKGRGLNLAMPALPLDQDTKVIVQSKTAVARGTLSTASRL